MAQIFEKGPDTWAGEPTRIVVVKGRRYAVGQVIPAADHGTWRIPRPYVRYWALRDDKAFGPTRPANSGMTPGTVGRAIWDAVETDA